MEEKNFCQHPSLVNTGEFEVCVTCGIVQQPNYQYATPQHAFPEKPGDLDELGHLIKETCARCHISQCILDRALDLLSKVQDKLKGKKHSAYSQKNIIICAYLLYLSFEQEGEPRSINDIQSMFGFASLGIKTKRFWKEVERLNDLKRDRIRSSLPLPSQYVRELLTSSDQMTLLRSDALQTICRLADAFVGTGNHRPKNVMLTLLYYRLCGKKGRKRLLESSFLSSSTLFRMNRKILEFEKSIKRGRKRKEI